jgi:osmoprotectant transport system ATP-binding protein
VIEIKDVSKFYEHKKVLDSIRLNFESGKTHVLLGSSGCGKSTLFRIILGLIPATSGEVIIDGVTMSPKAQRMMARKIGYVIQDAGLFPHLTGRDNVTLVMRTLKLPRDQIAKRVRELEELVGLDPSVLDRFPKELSGGQKQRVGLMRALMMNPQVLLLDEPLAALDPIARSDLQTEIKRICNALQKTVLFITHDLGEAAFFGHTITLMDQGKVVQHGTFAELAKTPASPFVSAFFHAQKPAPELTALL